MTGYHWHTVFTTCTNLNNSRFIAPLSLLDHSCLRAFLERAVAPCHTVG